MQLKGDKNIVANAGSVAQQITNINIESMNAEQFKALSEQMNQVLAAIGIKDEIGQEPAGVTPEQQVIGEAVQQKVDEADSSFSEPAGTLDTYFKLGNFEYESGNFEKAVEYYDKIIAINPQDDAAWNNKGSVLDDLDQKDEAIKCYDRAIEINPQDDAAWNNKGTVLFELGRKDEAIKCYDKGLEINPQYEYAWNNKGLALSDLGKKEKAIKCFDRVLDINPQHDYAWNNKGCCWGDMGVHDEACRCFDKAIEINPANKDARENRDVALNIMKNRG